MKACRDIRWELSAYLDGELTPPRRTEVEAHLASCARCQQELLEMKKLVTGMAALPKLQPAPRFLTEVRRKIARGEHPEAPTWQDHVFRPVWLKVPLEVAALIVIIGLLIREEHPVLTQKVARLESARTENSENDVSPETATKPPVADVLKSTPAFRNVDEPSAPSPSSPSPVIGAMQSMEFAQAKPGETVTVHAPHFDDVRSRAQRLAARCGGRIVVVPQPKDATEQAFFVELPQEYVAAFKLELLKTSESSATVPSTGVLTGNAATTNSINAPGPLGLGDEATVAAPTAVLEIRVVTPAN